MISKRDGQIYPLLLVGFALVAMACFTALAVAAIYPGFINMITDPSLVFTVPQVPKPSYLVPITDPTFGTKVIRIANDSGQTLMTSTGTGTWSADARHMYSRDQPWNSNGTLIWIENKISGGGSPRRLLLDGETYVVKYGICDNYVLGDDRWHPSPQHPNERVNVNGSSGTELMWFDVVTCTKTRTWALPFGVHYIGETKGNVSADGRFVALNDGARMFVVDMDPQPPFAPYPSQRIGPTYGDLSACGLASGCTIAWVSVSDSGKYVVVSYKGDHPRVFDVNPDTLVLTPHRMPLTSPRCSGGDPLQGFIYDLGHADMTMNPFDNNEDVLVGQEECGNKGKTINRILISGVLMVRLRDGAVTSLTGPTNEAYPHHISTRNYNHLGWAYVSYYPGSGKRFNDEIVAIKLDGSKSVQRFGHKHSAFSGCYRCESHAVPAPDGRRIIFASNWAENCGAMCGATSEIKDYVIDVRAPPTGCLTHPRPPSQPRLVR